MRGEANWPTPPARWSANNQEPPAIPTALFFWYNGARPRRLRPVRRQQVHTRRFGWRNFRARIITSTVERADTVRALIARTHELKSSLLFLFADPLADNHSRPIMG